ncbi:MAG: xylulokinase [Lachnospiraceae bacterium]|nr:xylulokinase [Lachnospiraceae bacterium]
MKRYLLGIDIGTSACKAAIFERDGTVAAAGAGEYPVYYPHPGWAEQNPENWWSSVCAAVKQAIRRGGIDPSEIAGIGIDGQSWSAVAVDQDGKSLCNTPIWMDTRAKDICDRINERLNGTGRDVIFDLAGNSLQPSYTTAKILWYQENRPEVFGQIHQILQSNSYIAFRLTGVFSQDVSQGYGLHCFDMHTGTWNLDMCGKLGIPSEFLPPIYPCDSVIGTVTEEAARQTGLAVGTPVVAGGLDAACGALGTGVLHDGETQEQGGQAGGMSICTDTYRADPRLILSYHVVPGKWLLQGGTTGGGGVMRWIEKEFAGYERLMSEQTGKSSLEQLNEIAEKIPAGSDGLVFLPYMSGERSPIWDVNAKGVFYGLDFAKTKGHMVRAAMEGVAFSLRHNLEVAEKAGAEAKVLRAMGGSANSLLWTQIKSDVTGKPIVVPSSDTATTLGAAILAGVGTGFYTDYEEAVALTVRETRRHEPNAGNQEIYQKNYDTYLALYENLKELMAKYVI